jgi:hypothetical protein
VRGGSVTEIEWRPAYRTTEWRMHVHH